MQYGKEEIQKTLLLILKTKSAATWTKSERMDFIMKLPNNILLESPILSKLISGDFTVLLDQSYSDLDLKKLETSKTQDVLNFRNWELVKGLRTYSKKNSVVKFDHVEGGTRQDFRVFYEQHNSNWSCQIDLGDNGYEFTQSITESFSKDLESDFTKLETDLLLALKTALIHDGLDDLLTVVSRILGQEEGTGSLAYCLAYIKFHQK